MTVIVAKNSIILRKRLMRYFSRTSGQGLALREFLDNISQEADILLFGGAIRDIALNGIRQFDSDLDFVFAGDSTQLQTLLSDSPVKANKFGGYRLQNNDLDLDIWPISETWAFKQSLVDYHSIASLLNTTITNWDAILFSWQNKKLIYPDDYFKHLNSGYLDIVLDINPNELGLVIRILRHFVLKEANIFSPRLIQVLDEKLQKYDFNDISVQEQLSYRETYITPSIIDYLKQTLSKQHNKNTPITLDKFFKTLPLF